ncbi:phosphoglucosamine mutase [Candidatus Saccharibacteria bacterium]|nr:phosphoglucosamine mutase [Candidatus Saccharibacteria bacterium]
MKYFGTDGIRQPADQFTSEFLTRIVKGLIDYAGDEIKIMLGGDTRESTEWILQDLETACESFGIEYMNVGVLPTPAINYCFYQMGFDFAIDVTASHNPYTDNGIKVFERGSHYGQKLSEQGCKSIETALDSAQTYALASTTIREDLHSDALELYLAHLLEYLGDADFTGLSLAMDCADGATSVINQTVFDELGAKVTLIHANSNYNTTINHDCGSTHLDSLKDTVVNNHLDFGIAFDGDGDRCLFIDHQGNEIDGDQIIAILANHLKLNHIAITVMANQGLLNWASDNHIATEITPVGDSNVAAAMRTHHIPIGGEQSGHIILPNEPTGDGMLTSLMLTKVIAETGKSLHNLASLYHKSPQVIVNLPATNQQKTSLKSSDSVQKLLLDYGQKLEAENGRLLVRPSGTEPLIRITIWGNDEANIKTIANKLKNELETLL